MNHRGNKKQNKDWDSELWRSPPYFSAMLNQFWSSLFPLTFPRREKRKTKSWCDSDLTKWGKKRGPLICPSSSALKKCNPYQATNGILHRARTNNFTICMEIQKTLNSQSYLEKEEWNWRNQPAWLQALLQSHSYQDSMVLEQRQKYWSMEQNRKPRDKSTHIWTPYLWQRRQEYTMD